MSPLEFMQRLAVLVPRPRLNLIRFHGILAPNAKHRAEIIPNEVVNANHTTDKHGEATCPPSATRISWARLLKRVFDIDIEHCPHCGGELKIIAAIEEPTVIAKILAHLGFPTRHLRYAILLRLRTSPSPPWLGRSLLERSSPTSRTAKGILFIRNCLTSNPQPL